MVDISLDLNPSSNSYKDVLVIDGDLVLTSDSDANGADPVVQNIIQRIQWFYGEWFLNVLEGVPWFQEVFIKNPDQDKVDALLLGVIANTPGILAVTSYDFTLNAASRSVEVNFRAQKTTGIIDYSGTVEF